MPRKSKKPQQPCQEHIFQLKAKSPFCYFEKDISISFCATPSTARSKPKQNKCTKQKPTLDFPKFNKDNNYSTPTFILKSEQNYYVERASRYKQEHNRKMIDYSDEKSQINIPKPKSKTNYCSVCRQTYDDYRTHIEGDKHKQKIRHSMFNRYILEMEAKFNVDADGNLPSKMSSVSTKLNSEEFQMFGCTPKKKLKGEDISCFPYPTNYPSHQMFGQITPPPHLNINHSGYFPKVNYPFMSNPIPSQLGECPHMTFNYNMNIMVNPFNCPFPSPNFNSVLPSPSFLNVPNQFSNNLPMRNYIESFSNIEKIQEQLQKNIEIQKAWKDITIQNQGGVPHQNAENVQFGIKKEAFDQPPPERMQKEVIVIEDSA